MSEQFLNGKIELHCGDCLEILPTLPENSIDSCVTDPPYHLTSIVKRFGKNGSAAAQYGTDGRFRRVSAGFMNCKWDGGNIAQSIDMWREVCRILKPGAHLVAFGGTRTYHRMACAIEDAGFEIRDCIQWLYGSGFPKSHNIGNGWGTALKPACEPIVLARKPLSESTIAANVLKWGTGAINVDGCRVATDELTPRNNNNTESLLQKGFEGKPKTIYPSGNGRWPANIIHDGSEEAVRGFPESDSGASGYNWADSNNDNPTRIAHNIKSGMHFGDSGSAARFFYTAKADSDDRLGSKHPTVKPLDLIQYLVRLVTPKGGQVLDMFAGTGTAGEAAWREGMKATLIERESEYQVDTRRRMELAMSGPDERGRQSIKARQGDKTPDHGPLFGGY